ncbi:gag/pol protein [Cucumis melo var. makuwa]|nr:gag/pol protein [Cucumis melo var. makuwa]
MDSLSEMFGQPSWFLRPEAFKHIYTKKMKEGNSVREHVLDMMMHFNIAETNASLNKIELTLTTLLNELQRFQNLIISNGKKVAKGKCYYCNENGHWLINCSKYLAEKKAEKEAQGKYDLLVVERCLVEYDTSI